MQMVGKEVPVEKDKNLHGFGSEAVAESNLVLIRITILRRF